MNIDFSQIITAADKAALSAAQRAETVKAECTRRIVAILDMPTTLNLQGAAIAGALSRAETATFKAARAWMREMQLTCRAMIADDSADPFADANWPALPEGVSALAALY